SASLMPWERLTLGKPAALAEAEGTAQLESDLARLVGCEAAAVGTSTLHLFFDLFEMLGGAKRAIFVDQGLYPIARWGAERAAATGIPIYHFGRHDREALQAHLRTQPDRRPIVVTDGLCPSCGMLAPLAEYAKSISGRDGLLVVDDTQ